MNPYAPWTPEFWVNSALQLLGFLVSMAFIWFAMGTLDHSIKRRVRACHLEHNTISYVIWIINVLCVIAVCLIAFWTTWSIWIWLN